VFRADAARVAGGFDPATAGAQDHDLYLKLTEQVDPHAIVRVPGPLYSWRAARGSTAWAASEKPTSTQAQRTAVRAHCKRIGLDATVGSLPGAPYTRVAPRLPSPTPRVSVLLPTRDRADLLPRSAAAALDAAYSNLELLILDNGSQAPDALAAIAALAEDARVRVLRLDYPFDFARLMNDGAAAATGEVLVLLNDDVEARDRTWLPALVAQAALPSVGAAGALLLYPDGRIQHAGITLGVGGAAGHRFKGARGDAPGPFHRLRIAHEVSAVTGACLATRKAVWEELGGLDRAFAVAFNDVDYCLRAQALGLSIVFTPEAVLIHHESASRGQADGETLERRSERAQFQERWADLIADDPHYNPLLTRAREDGGLDL
jgi:O-antigen biosynthesis protein